jgi:hypothetical protein
VNYLLGGKGQSIIAAHGLSLVKPPQQSGGDVPSSLHSVLPAS